MATVPYQPVPTVSPEAAPTRPLNIHTNGAMFGENIGAALDSAGHDVSRVGNELYQTAINFRKLDIENEVNKELTATDLESGDLVNKFHLMEGKDPQEQIEGFRSTLDGIRQSHRNNLKTDYAKQQYDRATMRDFGHMVVNAGGYAAGQYKAYTKGMWEARKKGAIDKIGDNPGDEAIVQQRFKEVEDLVEKQMETSGLSPEVLDQHKRDELSAAVDKVATTIKNPDQARAFVNMAKGKINEVAFKAIMARVEDRGVGTRAEDSGNKIADPAGSILDRARATTKKQESGGNYGNVTTTISQRTGQPQSALGAYGVMDFQLAEWTKKAIGREVSRDEFLRSPDIQDKVYDTYMGDYIRRFGVEGAGRAWLGGEGGVGHPERKDSLGTPVGVYGAKFAAQVGAYNPKQLGEKDLAGMYEAARLEGERLYGNDPERKAIFIDKTRDVILRNAKRQNAELADKELRLTNNLMTTMNTEQQNGYRPRNPEEARRIDPDFDQKVEDMEKLKPGYKKSLEHTYSINGKQELPYSVERENNYVRTVGMSDEEVQKLKPDEMADNAQISHEDARKIKLRQSQITRRSETDYHVNAIMGSSANASLLNEMEAYPSKNNQKANDRHNWLRGRLKIDMEDFEKKNNAPMDPRQRQELFERLAQEVVVGQRDTFGGLPFISSKVDVKDREFVREHMEEEEAKKHPTSAPTPVFTPTYRKLPNGEIWMRDKPGGDLVKVTDPDVIKRLTGQPATQAPASSFPTVPKSE